MFCAQKTQERLQQEMATVRSTGEEMSETNSSQPSYTIAMIGAGPAALYSTAKLTEAGHDVVIINRDIKPGGLAEFGIYPTKYKMKRGLRMLFRRILSDERVSYFGNVSVGVDADITIDEIKEMGFDATLVAVGAQGTKWLGLPGEDAEAVFHAKDLVYHYNSLPPFSEQEFPVGQNVCVVGLGNVCLDVVHWLACEKKVESVTAVARRGPQERKTTKKELRIISAAIDVEQLQAEFDTIRPVMESVGQEPDDVYTELTRFIDRPLETDSPTKFRMRFLRSPQSIEVDNDGQVTGLTCQKTRLVRQDEDHIGLEKLDEYETLECDTVVFAIGDSIEPTIGLPVDPQWKNSFATVPEPWHAHPDRPRYMVYDPKEDAPMWGTFVLGWARQASDGLVGKAKADGEQGCKEVLAYLNGEFPVQPDPKKATTHEIVSTLLTILANRETEIVDYDNVAQIEAVEQQKAEEHDLEEFKFTSQEKMLELVCDT
jgi:ferredoxin--NADP+ reductase